MILAVLQLAFSIPHAESLKDKRRALRSVKDRLCHGFNVSVAETDQQDVHRRGVLTVAMVGSDRPYVEGAMRKAIALAATAPDLSLDEHRLDFM